MKPFPASCMYLLFAVVLSGFALPVMAQEDSSNLQVICPFDSLDIKDVKATGNLKTGAVQMSMQVRNGYHKLAQVDFGGGAFGDFGLIDDKGIKYKYSSYEGPGGINAGVNKGYARITDLQFGKSKVTVLISVQDTLHSSQAQSLSFRLPKVDKSVKSIKEVHILSTLMLHYMFVGQKEIILKNIPVEWVKPQKQSPIKKSQ